jgi:uncharacterized cupin superfamily protein
MSKTVTSPYKDTTTPAASGSKEITNSNGIVIASAPNVDLKASPITKEWVLSGKPEARNRKLAVSADRTSSILVWDCTAGSFNWYYDTDETIVVLSGEALITSQEGVERRITAGDVVFFPAGVSATWLVPNYIRKAAVFRQSIPGPLAMFVRVWTRMLRKLGRKGSF